MELGEEEILISVSCRMCGIVPVTEEVEHRGDQLQVVHVREGAAPRAVGIEPLMALIVIIIIIIIIFIFIIIFIIIFIFIFIFVLIFLSIRSSNDDGVDPLIRLGPGGPASVS